MSFFVAAPVSAITASTSLIKSSAFIAAGRYFSSTAISAFSTSARSCRLADSYDCTESWRFLISRRTTTIASGSSRSASAPCFSMAAYLMADFNPRTTLSATVSLARMAVFMSSTMRAERVLMGRGTGERESWKNGRVRTEGGTGGADAQGQPAAIIEDSPRI